MEIDDSAPVCSKHEVFIKAPTAKVWRLLKEIEAWPQWNPAIQRARLAGPFEVGNSFQWKSGGVRIISTLQEIEPEARLVWSGKAVGIQAVHVWTLKLTTKGLLVSTSESYDGWLVKVFKKSTQTALDHALIDWLYELKRKAEGV